MTGIKAPKTSDGLLEDLLDPQRVNALFRPEAVNDGTAKQYMADYAQAARKGNPVTDEDMKAQVQSVLADIVRENGGGKSPAVGFQGGRPVLGADSLAAISHGRGTAYNKAAPGHKIVEMYKDENDRFTSMVEYCRAIREEARPSASKDRAELLRKLENVRNVQNSFGSEDPSSGGFLIPEQMRSELLHLALEDSIVRRRATVIPMSTLRVPIPTVDDTSHVSSLFGGVQFYWTEESAALTESNAKFGKVALDAKKLTGFFKTPNELLADAPAFSAWFNTRVPAGLAWAEDVAFLTETGAGTPQGVLSSPASVSVAKETGQATGTIVWENIVKMYARMLPSSIKNAVWVCAIDTFPELATMALSVGTGGGPIWIGSYGGPNGGDTPPMTILGRPVIFTEKVPALSTTGDISFLDLSYYLIGDRQSIEVSASEHAFFQNDQTAYKIVERVDGRPWLQSALTPHNGSSNTLSPFVQLATR